MLKQVDLKSVVVRPIRSGEESSWNELMKAHHYLGFRQLVGESIKYVATIRERPVALLGWGTAAFKCTSRDQWIGWSKEQQWNRLFLLVNNLRFLILPGVHIRNLASKILAMNVRRLSADWVLKYDHPVILAETFVDHSLFKGTSYRAAGWKELGTTTGYGRTAGKYYYHGQSKTIYVYPLHSKAQEWLNAPFLAPELCRKRSETTMADLNKLNIYGAKGLLERLHSITDPRKPRGVRHSIPSTLAIAACATLSGYRSYDAIGEWAQDLTQEQLARFGCYYHREQKKYIAPSEPTIRRHLQSIDSEEFDYVIGSWLESQCDTEAIAVDGKALRGTRTESSRAQILLSAFSSDVGTVLAQRSVGAETNEITEFQKLLDPVPLKGKVVTADAMHTQVEHAEYLVNERGADYVLTVKGNQETLRKAIEDLEDEDFSP